MTTQVLENPAMTPAKTGRLAHWTKDYADGSARTLCGATPNPHGAACVAKCGICEALLSEGVNF